MRCAKCDKDNPADASFCEECGARVKTTCSNCGKPLTPGKRFCRSCCAPAATADPFESHSPALCTPAHVAEKILTSRNATEGEREQATLLFADLKGSMELLAARARGSRAARMLCVAADP
jgi:hypothetical protein